jgi:uncharacterized cupredoxin-like copper-binding protein
MFKVEFLSNKRVILLFTAMAALTLVIGACQASGEQASSIPEVVITASDYAYDNPAEIQAGPTYIKMENVGEEIHHVQLLRLNDGVTLEQFQAALQQGEETALPLVTFHGGVGIFPKGGSGRVLVNLEEGQYVLACFIPSPDGIPHLAKGMLTPMKVVANGTTGAVQVPEADVKVALKDFNFVLPENINSGKQTWEISNEGPQPHEIIFLKLGDNMTMADIQAYFESMDGPPPFEFAGGMQGLSAGESGILELDLKPGSYIVACEIPDPATGMAHSALGMVMQFDVQ